MENKRLHSYFFNCPCCSQPHARLFEYYAKFRGLIPETEPITEQMDATLIERVVMDEDRFAGRSLTVGDGVFRCGNCYEFFKFNGPYTDAVSLSREEKEIAITKFKPVRMRKYDAMRNAFEMLKKLTTNNGYSIDDTTGEICFLDGNGKEYKFKIADELIEEFYGANPNFKVDEGIRYPTLNEEAQKGAI